MKVALKNYTEDPEIGTILLPDYPLAEFTTSIKYDSNKILAVGITAETDNEVLQIALNTAVAKAEAAADRAENAGGGEMAAGVSAHRDLRENAAHRDLRENAAHRGKEVQ